MAAKKVYKAGDVLTMRIRKDDVDIMEWASKQSEIGDSIRYLIEQEIQLNKFKDLATEIPNNRKFRVTAIDVEGPLLALFYEKKEPVLIADTWEPIADYFELSEDEREQLNRYGERQIYNVVRYAKEYLKRKGLVEGIQRDVKGYENKIWWQITKYGIQYYESKRRKLIEDLRKKGHDSIADEVDAWRNKNSEFLGYDTWFANKYPELAKEFGIKTVPINRRNV